MVTQPSPARITLSRPFCLCTAAHFLSLDHLFLTCPWRDTGGISLYTESKQSNPGPPLDATHTLTDPHPHTASHRRKTLIKKTPTFPRPSLLAPKIPSNHASLDAQSANLAALLPPLPAQQIGALPAHLDGRAAALLHAVQPDRLRDAVDLVRGEVARGLRFEAEREGLFLVRKFRVSETSWSCCFLRVGKKKKAYLGHGDLEH
jgi:hypothetical protein